MHRLPAASAVVTVLALAAAAPPARAQASASATLAPITVTVSGTPGAPADGSSPPGLTFAQGATAQWYFDLRPGVGSPQFVGSGPVAFLSPIRQDPALGGSSGTVDVAGALGTATLGASTSAPAGSPPGAAGTPVSSSEGYYGFLADFTLAPFSQVVFATQVTLTASAFGPGSATVSGRPDTPLDAYASATVAAAVRGRAPALLDQAVSYAMPYTVSPALPGATERVLDWGPGGTATDTFLWGATLRNDTAAPLAGYLQVDLLAGASQWYPSSAVTPVPEPASLALMLAGLGVVGVAARRRPSHRAAAA